jgi:hypothetical protein
MLILLLLAGALLLIGIFVAVLCLKCLVDIAEFICTAVLAIWINPRIGIPFAFALIVFVILIARWAGA